MVIDQQHSRVVVAALRAVMRGEPNPLRVLLALEDAYVILELGLVAGLSIEQVCEQVEQLLAEDDGPMIRPDVRQSC